jgi:hypothetical protein
LRKPQTTARPTGKTGEPRRPINRPKIKAIATWHARSASQLSTTYAHNVTVIARNGTVMLKAPVRIDEEKSAIEAKAVEIAEVANVKREIAVKSKTAN